MFPTSTAQNFQMVVTPQNQQDAATDIDAAAERPRAVTKLIQYIGGQPTVFKGKISLPKLMGQTSKQYKDNENCSTLFNSNPTERAMLYMQGLCNSAITYRAIVQLIYYVECFDPQPVAQS